MEDSCWIKNSSLLCHWPFNRCIRFYAKSFGFGICDVYAHDESSMVRRELLELSRHKYDAKQDYIRWRLNHQYRFNDDVCIVGTDKDGNSLEVDELQDQLVEIIDGSTEVKKLVTTLRKDLGKNWLFPGDPDFAWEGLMLPNDCQTLLPAIRKVLDVPHDPNMITEYDQLENELRARIGVKWRFPCDETFVTKEDGSCWEIDVLGHQLETVLEVSSNVKKVISYVRKQLGDDWLFPGDDGYDSEPSGEMKHIRVLLQEIVDFKNCKPADD